MVDGISHALRRDIREVELEMEICEKKFLIL